jgi:DNA relaxase NicK
MASQLLAKGFDGCPSVTHEHSTTTQPKISRLLDYWKVTHADIEANAVLSQLELWLDLDFEETRGGKYYASGATALGGCIRVLWGNVKTKSGCCVEFTGQGMRHVEAQPGFRCWRETMARWMGEGWKCRRLDVAIDDLGGAITWDHVYDQVMAGNAITRAIRNGAGVTWMGTTVEGGRLSRTLYVGSRKHGEMMMRAYEKGVQLGHEVPWLRFELQISKDRAHSAMCAFVADGFEALTGAFRNFIEFKNPGDVQRNNTRRRCAEWWADLLSAAKYKLAAPIGEKLSAISKAAAWVEHSAGAWIAALVAADGGSLDALYDIARRGQFRMKDRHRAAVRQYGRWAAA